MRVITLTTDFGLQDHYVAAMKGVILTLAGRVSIVDVAHDMGVYSIAPAAYTIGQVWKTFPKRTVHLVVVDPGVGSERRPILAEAGGQYFVAPDNGVLSLICAQHSIFLVRHITNTRYFRKSVGQTFHGRDVFAPVAAHLAKGADAANFGPEIQDFVRLDYASHAHADTANPDLWHGHVLHIDHFGNVVTSISSTLLAESHATRMDVCRHVINRVAANYASMPAGGLCLIAGSAGYVEISANQKSAAVMLGCKAGDPISFLTGAPASGGISS